MTDSDLDDILGDIDDNEIDRACATIIHFADDLDDDAAAAIMAAAYVADRTLSGVGAMIRDTLRDNTDLTIL
jgi:hypothetical protein